MNHILKAINGGPDPARAKHYLSLLAGTRAQGHLKKFTAGQAKVLAALLSGSQAMSGLLIADPDLLSLLHPEKLQHPRRKDGLERELTEGLEGVMRPGEHSAEFKFLRQFKQREMLRIAARDLGRFGNASEITQEISDLADVCLGTVWEVCMAQMTERYGRPWHQDPAGKWHPTQGCVLGLGKLGGQELNYSSDVDVIFVYAEEGTVSKTNPQSVPGLPGKKKRRSSREPEAGASRGGMSNHQFFNRLAESFIAEVTRLAPEGVLYRIDLRLRPEGDAGPLSRGLADYENYYAQWGQTWERMMLIKARKVAGDDVVAGEFLEMIQSFRYPRSVSPGVLREVAAMKDRIENEVLKADELDRNVKLGRGGIREIEFAAQTLQLLHAGRQPFLQGARTLPTLEKLVQYELLSFEDQQSLTEAYLFLRDVEHRLQMEDNRQTHTIPEDRGARDRLARLMGFASLRAFEGRLVKHTQNVRRIFHQVLQAEAPEDAAAKQDFPREFGGFEPQWKSLLAARGFRDPEKAFRTLREFVEGPGFVHVSSRTRELAFGLLPRLLDACPGRGGTGPGMREAGREGEGVLSDPDRVVTRLDSFISAYGARTTLFELWSSNTGIFELLARLFDRSEFLAELAIRDPDLVDELVTSGRLRQRKTAEETLADLRHGLQDTDQHTWLRRYHRAELMRIGLRDILGVADFEQYLVELSALAEACLQYSLEAVMKRNRIKRAPFAIIGLGKLGGAEIDYGSDLDILFVADSKAKNLTYLAKLARELMDLISTRTSEGLPFHSDARLRPDGEKGLLVNTLKAYEEYYRKRAMLWEIQSLTRTRPVAGDRKLGEQFLALAGALSNFQEKRIPLSAHTPDWKQRIHHMRMRIEKERTRAGQGQLAIKTGAGGLMDAEFVAQAVSMERGWYEPNTLRSLERARASDAFEGAGDLIENYRKLRRVEGILRRWSYEGETVLPADPAAYYRVAIRCGFSQPEGFRDALAGWRGAIREVYSRVFQGAS